MNIAITGGTGTLGRVLIARFLKDGHERVVSISRDEVKAGDLRNQHSDNRLNVFLGDVRDRERLTLAFRGCDAVIHAAALKRVPVGEAYDSLEMIKTNITGTVNTVLAAMAVGVKKVIVVSSDKAVHPENLYGGTKLVAEKFAVQANEYTHPAGTMVSVVRYGNVWRSRGSVVEVWEQAQLAGNPAEWTVPLTDERMTRFVITQAQAADLICLALDRMVGGEVFVPQLRAMRLPDLAEAMGAGYKVVGLRPGGEKLHEQMVSEEEYHRVLRVPESNTYLITPSHRSWSQDNYKGTRTHLPYPYRSDNVEFLSVEELRAYLCNS